MAEEEEEEKLQMREIALYAALVALTTGITTFITMSAMKKLMK